jgi:hypothetical protein
MADELSGQTAIRGSSLSRRQKALLPRKKACQPCTAAKVRCDLKRPHCSRCETRQVVCVYAVPNPVANNSLPTVGNTGVADRPNDNSHVVDLVKRVSSSSGIGFGEPTDPATYTTSFGNSPHSQIQEQRTSLGTTLTPENEYNDYWASTPLNFAVIRLICPVDATRIRNRWLADFIPSLTDRIKIYSPGVFSFISRVLKTYPAILLRKGQLPPFIHPSQLAGPDIPTPLANCLSLVRLWDGQVRGSEAIVCETIKKEMDRLYSEVHRPLDI